MPVSGNPRAKQAWDFFTSRGYSAAQTAGILGNLIGESGLDPSAVGDGGLAKGLAQHHPDRWAAHLSRTSASGTDPNDFNAQLDFIDWELRNKEQKAFNRLMKATTVDQATAAFIGFERPQGFTWDNPTAGHNYSGRLSGAQEAYQLFGASAGGSGLSPPQQLTFAATEPNDYQVNDPSHAVGISDVTPVDPYSTAELSAFKRAEAEDAAQVSLWQGVQDAVSEGWSGAFLFEGREDLAPDPDFRMSDERMKQLTEGVPEQYWDRFTASHSDAHADQIKAGILKSLEGSERLNSMGGMGVALRLAAGFTDPLAWAAAAGVSIASGGLGAPAALGARFGRLGLVAEGAVVGALGNVAADSLRVANSYTADSSELLWSAGAGLVLGGAFGGIVRNPATAGEARRIEQIGRDLQNSTALTPDNSAGAMAVSARQDLRATTADIVRDADEVAPKSFASRLRFDLAGYLKGSDNKLTRALGNVLVEDGARNADGVTPIGASEWQSIMYRRAELKWRKGFDTAFNEYAKRTGVRFGQRDAALADFSEQVTRFVRNRDDTLEFDPAIMKAGTEFRSIMARWAELAQDPGLLDGTVRRSVRGAENLQANQFYVPRIFDRGAVLNAINRFGHGTLTKFVAQAMRGANPELADEVAQKFAAGYVKKLHQLSAGELMNAQRAFSGEDLDELGKMLSDVDIAPEEVSAILAALKPKPQDGASPRLKHRLIFDEAFTARLRRSDGTADEAFSISDLFVNDADFLMTAYSRQMSGRVAMARVRVKNPKWKAGDETPEYLVDGVTSDGEFRTLLDEVRSVSDATGGKQFALDAERLQFTYNSIIGRQNFDEGSAVNQGLRLLRDYNFLRVMNQVGFAQLSELASVTAQLGLRAMFHNMPSLRSMWRNGKTGKLDDAFAEEVEDVLTVGTDWVRHSTMTRVDEFGDLTGSVTGSRAFQQVDSALQKGKKLTAAVSGMAPINTFLQRLTGRAIFNKFAILARQGGKTATRRMQALGLDQAMLDRVTAQINTHAKFKKGVGGRRLQQMGLNSWDDVEAKAAFEMAAFRLSRSIIQENDLGNMSKWMSSPMMRTVLQFRSFMLAAWSKQFLQGLNHMDSTTLVQWGTSVFVAGLAYTARTHLNSIIGRQNFDEGSAVNQGL
ncbi:MAG: hypothetical protein J0I48_15570, partial [Devosia sp.]|nr:hypothetical protein [Devosia sp.]